jgi:ABC-type antimicrobial peptide transport system permease subunit
MAIPLKYNIGNLTARLGSTALTVLGIGVVIAVMLSMMALLNGVQTAIVSSGSPDNMMVMRDGSTTEISSFISRDSARILAQLPGIAKGSDGQPIVSPELVILFKLPKKDNPQGSNVVVRGVGPAAFELRPFVKVVEGRMYKPGVNEVIVSRRIRDRFVNADIGDSFHFGAQDYHVVGVFDGKGTSFDSEVWTDIGFLSQARHRVESCSDVMIRPVDAAAFRSIKDAIANDNRLKLMVKSERQYYDEQTKGLIGIVILVTFITLFMTVGAVFGTMNSMFAAVASRTRELGTLRALGFKRRAIIGSVLIESAFIALLGGIAGIILSLPVNMISTGTTNFTTFSEVAFNFRVDGKVALIGLIVALVAGMIGGFLPAVNAARMPITKALREI